MEFESISLLSIGFLLCAAFLAGFIDSIAGGGGLISLPATLVAGIPPHLALGTSKFMSTCGTTFALGFYAKSKLVDWGIVAKGILFSIAGSVLGTRLALSIDSATLAKVILVLLPLAAIISFIPWKKPKEGVRQRSDAATLLLIGLVCGLVGMYDGFFGPGTGSFLIMGLHFVIGAGLVRASGTAKAFNLASNASSFFTFLMSGQVLFALALPMAFFNIVGNILGSRLAINKGAGVVRACLYVSLSLLFITLLWRYYGS